MVLERAGPTISSLFTATSWERLRAGTCWRPKWPDLRIFVSRSVPPPLGGVGSQEFVEACREAGIPRYVLSGTPQKPLEDMLRSTGAAEFFDVIIGSPPAKPESLTRILAETGTPPERTVFVGDANADHVAALHVGAHFVYFPSKANRPEGKVVTEVSDLRQLLIQQG